MNPRDSNDFYVLTFRMIRAGHRARIQTRYRLAKTGLGVSTRNRALRSLGHESLRLEQLRRPGVPLRRSRPNFSALDQVRKTGSAPMREEGEGEAQKAPQERGRGQMRAFTKPMANSARRDANKARNDLTWGISAPASVIPARRIPMRCSIATEPSGRVGHPLGRAPEPDNDLQLRETLS